MSEFEGKSVLVTGAGGVLGHAVAEQFKSLGANVAGLDVVPITTDVLSLECDLLNASQCQSAVERVIETHGQIDVLANIAGGFIMGETVAETSDDTWDFLFGLNTRSVVNMARVVVPHMQSLGGGKIVNVGARAATKGVGKMGAYTASKSAVVRLTEAMADELRSSGINVNCIMPGTIDTPRNRTDMPNADHSRWVPPIDLADVVVFLSSDAARAVHGAAIPVDGLS